MWTFCIIEIYVLIYCSFIADQINTRGSISGKNEFNGKVNKEFRAEIVIGAPVGGKSSVIVDKASKDTVSCS